VKALDTFSTGCRNLRLIVIVISKLTASLKSQAQGTSLFTGAASKH